MLAANSWSSSVTPNFLRQCHAGEGVRQQEKDPRAGSQGEQDHFCDSGPSDLGAKEWSWEPQTEGRTGMEPETSGRWPGGRADAEQKTSGRRPGGRTGMEPETSSQWLGVWHLISLRTPAHKNQVHVRDTSTENSIRKWKIILVREY